MTENKIDFPKSIEDVPTKSCHLVMRPGFDGYGFNLHSEKSKPGQFIGKVDSNSPAEEAGLKEGDRIIEVNGELIENETHKQVVKRIRAISCEVRLLLIDADYCSSFESQEPVHQNSTKSQQVQKSNVNGNEIEAFTANRDGNIHNITKSDLQLPTTAAEMRAKLLRKKKYDPKNEIVDLKEKFDIIQKL